MRPATASLFALGLLALLVHTEAQANPVRGYVLTHEHPVYGMAFGGNYAFAGRPGNYVNGIPEKGYDGECSGCRLGTDCDHGQFKGTLSPLFVGKDMGFHGPFAGPRHNSFSHLRYASDWTYEAFKPTKGGSKDSRMRIMVAFAVEAEAMCEQLYYPNRKAGGPGGKGYKCIRGDSFKSLERQIKAIKAWARSKPWIEVAYSAKDVRRIAAQNKLAVILGIESEFSFGNESSTFDPVKRLNEYYRMGVRTFYLAHKVNSRLAGADIFMDRKSTGGRTIRTIQSLFGCFYYDDNVGDFPVKGRLGKKLCDNEGRCGANALRGKITDACSYRVGEVSEANMLDYVSLAANKLDGFVHYPLPPGFTKKAVSFTPANSGGSVVDRGGVERNNLGLSHDGERVVREAMKKGMIVNIDHVSTKARKHIYHLATKVFRQYPLNALHIKPNERLTHSKSYKRHEYDFDRAELNYIKQTGGFFGYRAGPTDSKEYPNSGITANCPKTATETGKMLAWLIDQGFDVGYSLDFATVTQGVHSRTLAKCGLNLGRDTMHTYDGYLAEGLSHIGMMRHWHDELRTVGLKDKYLRKLKYDSAEAFIRMWEKSERAANTGVQIPRRVFAGVAQLSCKTDRDCGKGFYCNNRFLKANRCLPDGSTAVGERCEKNKECKTGKCQGKGAARVCVCNADKDCGEGLVCNKRLGKNRCLADGSLALGMTCSKNGECKTGKCQGKGGNRKCVCAKDKDCPGGQTCNQRLGQNRCLVNAAKAVGAQCNKNSECTSGKCQGSGRNRLCVCGSNKDCPDGSSCRKRLGKNICIAEQTAKALGASCSNNGQCKSGKCQGSGARRVCVCRDDGDCPNGRYCNNRLGANRCLVKAKKAIGQMCSKNAECKTGKCQGTGKKRACVCNKDSDCGRRKCKKRLGRKNICK